MRQVLRLLGLLILCAGSAAAQAPSPTPAPARPVINPSRSLFDEPRWRSLEAQRLADRTAQDQASAQQRAADEREQDQSLRRTWSDTQRQYSEDWRAHDDIARLRDLRQTLRGLEPPRAADGAGR
ncbi:MAG: hypothetical protein WDO24_29990 [Pseudomonadota bacterium]